MTRANIVLKQKYYPAKTYLEKGSDGYPSNVLPSLIDFLLKHLNGSSKYHKDLPRLYEQVQSDAFSELISDLYLRPGAVGNFSYAYEVDLVKETIKVWNSTLFWVNVPENWKEKGYVGITKGKNGKLGYNSWRKGKKLIEITLDDLLNSKTKEITVERDTIKYNLP